MGKGWFRSPNNPESVVLESSVKPSLSKLGFTEDSRTTDFQLRLFVRMACPGLVLQKIQKPLTQDN